MKDEDFDFEVALKREVGNDEILRTMFDLVLDGENDKQKIYAET
jgi:hypothetical protein